MRSKAFTESLTKKSLKNLKHQRHKLFINIPDKFSVFENPEDVIQETAKIAKATNNGEVESIRISHRRCKSHDLAAEVLLAGAAKDFEVLRQLKNRSGDVSGHFPKDKKMRRLVHSIGVVSELEGADSGADGEEVYTKVFKGSGDPKEQPSAYYSDSKNKVTKRLLQHINNCLGHIGYRLSQEGEHNLNNIVGEVIENAERHTGHKNWFAYGYLDEKDTENLCSEIVIYNIGPSIAQTLLDKRSNEYVLSDSLLKYLSDHSDLFSEEELATILALQQYISRLRTKEDPDCGQGLTDLLRFFEGMVNACMDEVDGSTNHTEMCIISGPVHMTFDGKYLPTKNVKNQDRCYLNSNNDPSCPPDGKYIRRLRGMEFPGTLIAIKFPIKGVVNS